VAGLTADHIMDEYLFPAATPTMKGLHAVTEAAHVANLPLVTDLAHQGWRECFVQRSARRALAGHAQFHRFD